MDKAASKVTSLFLQSKQAMEFTSIAPIITPEKPLNARELARALRLAISAEEDAVSLYELMADSTDDSDAKRVLTSIGNEEKVHISELTAILNKISPDEAKFKEDGEKEVKEETK